MDFVTICGNITDDGKADSFSIAAAKLATLLKQKLKNPDSSNAPNRVMVVPGPKDIRQDTPSYWKRYDAFRQDLFSQLFGPSRAMPQCWRTEPTQVDYRQLKHITLVGVRYWTRKNQRNGESHKHLADILASRLKQMGASNLAYAESTPTVLVSAESPLLASLGYRGYDEYLHQVFNERLRIWLHLFGNGPLTHLPSEPFRYQHHSIGTGELGEGESARFNLIEIDWPFHRCRPKGMTPCEPDQATHRVMTRSRHFICNRQSNEWSVADPRYFFLRARVINEKDDEKLMNKHLKTLEEKLFQSPGTHQEPWRAASLLFVPGSGLEFFFKKIADRTRLIDQKIAVTAHQVLGESGEWQSRWADITHQIEHQLRSGTDGTCRLLVVCDPDFTRLSTDEKEQRQNMIRQWMEKHDGDFAMQRLKLVYLSYDPDGLVIRGTDTILISDYDDTAIDEILNRFVYRIPLNETQLQSYLGNAVGLTRHLLDNASQLFETEECWPGESVLAEGTPRQLVRDVLDRRLLDKVMAHFFEWMHQRNGQVGRSLFLYIRRSLLRQSASGNRVDLNEFIDCSDKNEWFAGGESFVNQLCEMGYLQWEDENRKSILVKVLAPFLCEITYQLFLSHAGHDEILALKLKHAIEKRGRAIGHDVNVKTYVDEDWRGRDFITTDAAVEGHLKDSAGIIFLHRGGDDVNKGIHEEIEIWKRHGGGLARPPIRVLTEKGRGPSPLHVPELGRLQDIYLQSRGEDGRAYERDMDEIAQELLNYFGAKLAGRGRLKWVLRPLEAEQWSATVPENA
ncbi:hypothetical protein [Stieleria varia]|uniref:hypothetical protein n=1 Tax=Stieleria varia TaxID=2528005 RepID=UPI0018D21B8D|nr:hypothetical protein [Stieleria varia]